MALTTSVLGVCRSLGQFGLRDDAKKGSMDGRKKRDCTVYGFDSISVGCVPFSGPILAET